MPVATPCPDLRHYQSLFSGQLAVADKEALLQHLEGCDSCVQKIQSLPGQDTLIDWIKQARTVAATPVEQQLAALMQRMIQLVKPAAASSVSVAGSVVASRAAPPGGTLTFSCGSCKKPLRVKDEAAAKKVKCPHCKQVVLAPAATPAAPPEALETAVLPPASTSESATVANLPASSKEQELCAFLAPSQAPDEIGRLGSYRVLKVLGAGGMGVVFRAEDPQLQRLVALKAMLPALAANESARQRFLREARAAAKLKHDHIVTIHQVGEDRGAPFLAMEFLEGEALEDRLKREGKLPLSEVLRIGREIAEGLQAAHEHGLIHRDIKPANVWLEGKRGRAKILDFGLARSSADDVHLTQSGAIVGTPAYMPPEQARGEAVDARCDLYSLGCVLFRLCTGELPFKADNTMSLLLALATEQPKSPREINADVPLPLADLILRLLAKDATQRPATAGDVAQALQDIAVEKAPASAAATAPAPPRRRRKLLWTAAAGAFLVAAMLTVIVIHLGKPEEGTVTIETVDPDVELVFTGGGRDFTVRDKKTGEEIKLPLGSYQVALKGGQKGLKLETNQFTLKRGERRLVKVTLQPPEKPDTPRANLPPPVQVPEPPWVVYEGSGGPGKGKHIVLISGDEEYRSEEALPQLGKILAKHHGFKCTVLFAVDLTNGTINPDKNDNIPGLENLKTADLLIIFTRMRDLPDEQMKYIAEYVDAGKPIIGLRTATHAFELKSRSYGKYSWISKEEWKGGFGRQILGETWVAHWGGHHSQGTRGILVPSDKNHPILRGIKDGDIWGPTDVYEVHLPLGGDIKPLVLGQVLKGMKPNDPPAGGADARKNDPMMPIAWTKTYKSAADKTGRVFTTTMGSSQDLESEGLRRVLVNAAYWAVGMEDKIAANSVVAIVGEYKPLPFGIGGYKRGVKPVDLVEARFARGGGQAAMQIPEPPRLAEWLKGRKVLTVSQDGKGQYKTIQEALNALKPHQVVKVLDRGPYREILRAPKLPADTGLISEKQTVIELTEWRVGEFAQNWSSGHVFAPLGCFRLSGLRLLTPPLKTAGEIMTWQHASEIVLEDCHFRCPSFTISLPECILSFDDSNRDPKPVFVRNCLFDTVSLTLGGWSGRAPTLVVERNYFKNAFFSGTINAEKEGNRFQKLLIRHNVFDFPRSPIYFMRVKEAPEIVEISNNTAVLAADCPLLCFDFAAPRQGITHRNNISESSIMLRGEAAKTRDEAIKTWQVDHNSYPSRGSLPQSPTDILAEPQFLSVDPSHPNYLRIPADSPLAKGGAGGAWPSYIGALAPGPVPKDGDWFMRLREKWMKDKQATKK